MRLPVRRVFLNVLIHLRKPFRRKRDFRVSAFRLEEILQCLTDAFVGDVVQIARRINRLARCHPLSPADFIRERPHGNARQFHTRERIRVRLEPLLDALFCVPATNELAQFRAQILIADTRKAFVRLRLVIRHNQVLQLSRAFLLKIRLPVERFLVKRFTDFPNVAFLLQLRLFLSGCRIYFLIGIPPFRHRAHVFLKCRNHRFKRGGDILRERFPRFFEITVPAVLLEFSAQIAEANISARSRRFIAHHLHVFPRATGNDDCVHRVMAVVDALLFEAAHLRKRNRSRIFPVGIFHNVFFTRQLLHFLKSRKR